MPYIEQKDRERYAEPIDELLKRLGSNPHPGHVNYIISRLIWALLGGKPDYARCNEAMGILTCVMFELYRRRVAPSEDRKAAENDDLPIRQLLDDGFVNHVDDDDLPDPAQGLRWETLKVADAAADGTNLDIISCHYYHMERRYFTDVEASNVKDAENAGGERRLYLHRPILNPAGGQHWMVYTFDKRELEKREANVIPGVTDTNTIPCYYYRYPPMKKRHFVDVEVSNIIAIKNIDKETRRFHLHKPILDPDDMKHYIVYTSDKRELEKREANAIPGVTDPNVIPCYFYCAGQWWSINIETSNIRNADGTQRLIVRQERKVAVDD